MAKTQAETAFEKHLQLTMYGTAFEIRQNDFMAGYNAATKGYSDTVEFANYCWTQADYVRVGDNEWQNVDTKTYLTTTQLYEIYKETV